MITVFDTSYLWSLVDPNDENHSRAIQLIKPMALVISAYFQLL